MKKRDRWLCASLSLVLLSLAFLPGCQQFSRAKRSLSQATKTRADKAPKDEPSHITKAQKADMQFAQSRLLESRGDVEQAVAGYSSVVKLDPQRADAFQRLAILHDKGGNFEKSAEYYRKALKADRHNAEIHSDLGYSLSIQQRWDDAERSLLKAIELDPENARAHNNLGLVLAHTGRLDESLAEFKEAGCNQADMHANLAFCLLMGGHLEDAREHFELALDADSNSKRAKLGLRQLDSLVAKLDSQQLKDDRNPIQATDYESPSSKGVVRLQSNIEPVDQE